MKRESAYASSGAGIKLRVFWLAAIGRKHDDKILKLLPSWYPELFSGFAVFL
jgi:hypothetical protein